MDVGQVSAGAVPPPTNTQIAATDVTESTVQATETSRGRLHALAQGKGHHHGIVKRLSAEEIAAVQRELIPPDSKVHDALDARSVELAAAVEEPEADAVDDSGTAPSSTPEQVEGEAVTVDLSGVLPGPALGVAPAAPELAAEEESLVPSPTIEEYIEETLAPAS